MTKWWIIGVSGCALAGILGGWLWWKDQSGTENDLGGSDSAGGNKIQTAGSDELAESPLKFTNVASIDFRYAGGPSRMACMTEQNGGGVALADFDADGILDVFLANGATFEDGVPLDAPSNGLFRSDSTLQFEDVALKAGITSSNLGMGCAAGDYDNDGFVDLFLACYGRNRLWHNNGDGTFTETTDSAGVGDQNWGTSAAFADLDADGLLDLYVVNYVHWSPNEHPCNPPGHPEVNIVCSPMTRAGQSDLLFRNSGEGEFVEVGRDAGVALSEEGKGLALSVADFDADGRLDIYVANDMSANFLFRNSGNMRFEEVAVTEGVAFSSDGAVGASMGVAVADFDHNGHLDICVTNFANQINDLFANLGSAGFISANSTIGLDALSRTPLSFGIVFEDFDLNGWSDLFVANGHIWDQTSFRDDVKYRMKPQVLLNIAGTRFGNTGDNAGEYFGSEHLGRSAACGDLDNDGDCDLVVAHLDEVPAVLRNDSVRQGHSVRLQLIGTESSRQASGARVEIMMNGILNVLHVPAGGSFQASHSPVLIFAVGKATALESVQVTWSTGKISRWQNVPIDESPETTCVLIEGHNVSISIPSKQTVPDQ